MADRWLDLAPKPDALPAGKDWHVFLSYRSVNRPWVLALYDVLRLIGYKVFLDQYVLTAAAALAIALGDALDASMGAIMIWSGSYEDSEWCKQEFAKLKTLQSQKKGFRYVIARIDESEIAGFAAAKLWIDFSKQREGPARSGLLSLLYGLKGEPLSPAAVKLAAEVDAQMRDGLSSVRAARGRGCAARACGNRRYGMGGIALAEMLRRRGSDRDEEDPRGDHGARSGRGRVPESIAAEAIARLGANAQWADHEWPS